MEFGQLVTDTFRRKKPQRLGGSPVAGLPRRLARRGFHASSPASPTGCPPTCTASAMACRSSPSCSTACPRSSPSSTSTRGAGPNIHEHVITRTEDHLRLTALSALMNHGAMVFIDAIDPVGTVHTQNYELGGQVYADCRAVRERGRGPLLPGRRHLLQLRLERRPGGERPGRRRGRLHVRRLPGSSRRHRRPTATRRSRPGHGPSSSTTCRSAP